MKAEQQFVLCLYNAYKKGLDLIVTVYEIGGNCYTRDFNNTVFDEIKENEIDEYEPDELYLDEISDLIKDETVSFDIRVKSSDTILAYKGENDIKLNFNIDGIKSLL